MSYRYEFKKLSGEPCCKSNNIKLLCDSCVAQAIKHHEGTPQQAAHAEPPEPASLVNSIRERASLPAIELAPVPKLDVRFTPPAPTALHGVDVPPSLVDAIQAKGGRR